MVDIENRPAAAESAARTPVRGHAAAVPRAVAAAVEAEWVRCRQCAELVYGKRFRRVLSVCPDCGAHARLTARERLDQLLDPGTEVPIDAGVAPHDPLEFVDSRPYRERLGEARAATGMADAAIAAHARIEGRPVVVVAMDFRFLGGSLGCAVGELITLAAEESLRTHTPLLLVTASGGARMQEGALSLMQMAKTAQALGELDEAGVLVVSLVTDPTYGGVAASYATLADIILIEPGARMGFAGPRVIEQTIGERLPDGFQTAEFLLAHGMVDAIVPRAQLRRTLGYFLAVGDQTTPNEYDAAHASGTTGHPNGVAERRQVTAAKRLLATAPMCAPADGDTDSWDAVRLARHPERPSALDYAAHVLEDFHELHGDRLGDDCPAVVGGIGLLDARPVMFVGHHKGGADLGERQRRHFGMATPAGFRKAARLMRMAAKLRLPVITLVDTPGANPGLDAERGGQAAAIAENLRLMSRLPVPVVTVVTGEGGSGGALALAVADRVLISERGVYSVISPEGCAAILWKDPAAAPVAAAALRIGAADLLGMGVVDAIVPEPPGGAHTDVGEAAVLLREAVRPLLAELRGVPADLLVRERRARFRAFGATTHAPKRAQQGVS
ncbi:acetyl-CoA carboxylase, carboxyltransferase subunit beta [Yinghuangia sp. YIM S09857]|uniref:acetyl-CoA carboxylase, carboxyltransferase subunit beta n=1 Tax=Yinghuangia sp. YIM S09857 TaxID=3436929 RepID=UPI003F53BD89